MAACESPPSAAAATAAPPPPSFSAARIIARVAAPRSRVGASRVSLPPSNKFGDDERVRTHIYLSALPPSNCTCLLSGARLYVGRDDDDERRPMRTARARRLF